MKGLEWGWRNWQDRIVEVGFRLFKEIVLYFTGGRSIEGFYKGSGIVGSLFLVIQNQD